MQLDDPRHEYNPYAAPTTDDARSYGEDEPGEHVLAERGTRLGARILDNLLLVGSVLPVLLFFGVTDELGKLARDEEALYLRLGIGALLGPVQLVIYQWYLIATRGQTLGKKWTKIKIIKADGSRVDFMSGVVVRNWLIALPGLIPAVGQLLNGIVNLVDGLMIFSDDRRCLHDRIAGTKVVVAPPKAGS
ncbi:putative membrane protein [Sorangium cellulosum So ce56]|uniref:Membrane protein n=1 Tax=Sorangium cellulosum (strain So ce56) TaxID=448385 RepID=A9F7M8_SORC5|nr:RDD family protein [Sorangium cellulosum]CAN91552.1 putative membrane protein [Sorangium cellulosum So ce56]